MEYPENNFESTEKESDNALLERVLNKGNNKWTNTIANKKPTVHKKNDSPRNCIINCFLLLPITLRMPTSLALLTERAIERFTKFIQAINNTNNAIPESR